jgi:hypothetical protein
MYEGHEKGWAYRTQLSGTTAKHFYVFCDAYEGAWVRRLNRRIEVRSALDSLMARGRQISPGRWAISSHFFKTFEGDLPAGLVTDGWRSSIPRRTGRSRWATESLVDHVQPRALQLPGAPSRARSRTASSCIGTSCATMAATISAAFFYLDAKTVSPVLEPHVHREDEHGGVGRGSSAAPRWRSRRPRASHSV